MLEPFAISVCMLVSERSKNQINKLLLHDVNLLLQAELYH